MCVRAYVVYVCVCVYKYGCRGGLIYLILTLLRLFTPCVLLIFNVRMAFKGRALNRLVELRHEVEEFHKEGSVSTSCIFQ